MDTVIAFALSLLLHWLEEKNPGEDGASWVLGRDEIGAIPKDHYAVVRVELHKTGGEPKRYEKCDKCGEMHEVGTACPYARKAIPE